MFLQPCFHLLVSVSSIHHYNPSGNSLYPIAKGSNSEWANVVALTGMTMNQVKEEVQLLKYMQFKCTNL